MDLKVTHSILELFEKDLWKDARKLKIIPHVGTTAITRYSDQQGSITDEIRFLEEIKTQVSFKIPRILTHTNSCITFEYIEGTRAFNLLMDLSELYKSDPLNIYFEIAEKLIDILSCDLKEFQGAYQHQKDGTSKINPYPAKAKLRNVYGILSSLLSLEFNSGDLDAIASEYQANATVPFRDATPKNIILDIPELFQKRFKNRGDRLRAVQKLVNNGELENKIDKNNIYHIDFTGCKYLCSELDDWIALKRHQASSWLFDQEQFDDDRWSTSELCTYFVRFSRFAGRKLAYRLLNDSGHKIRFMLDKESLYFKVLETVCDRLYEARLINDRTLSRHMISFRKATKIQPKKDFFHQWKKRTPGFIYYSDIFPN